MTGRKTEAPVNWSLVYEILSDPRVAPCDRAAEAVRRGIDRSPVQVERYMVAASLVIQYHATDLINLRQVTDRIWAQLEQQLLKDVERQVLSSHPDAAHVERDQQLSRVTRPMIERAAAGWHAWQAVQAAPKPKAAKAPVPAAGEQAGSRLTEPGMLPAPNSITVTYVGPLPESYIDRNALPKEHTYVGYRFRVEGENLPKLTPEYIESVVKQPPECPATGFGFGATGSVDLFLYCATDTAPGQYQVAVCLPDGRTAAAFFRHPDENHN